jgi:hypothetical protein
LQGDASDSPTVGVIASELSLITRDEARRIAADVAKLAGTVAKTLERADAGRRVGSNPALGLHGFQPPKQNYADDSDKQNSQLHLPSPFCLSTFRLLFCYA